MSKTKNASQKAARNQKQTRKQTPRPAAHSFSEANGSKTAERTRAKSGRSNPIFALYVPANCVDAVERLIAGLPDQPAQAVDGARRKGGVGPGGRRLFIERVLARVATLQPEHLAAMPVSGRAPSVERARFSFSVGKSALKAADGHAKRLGISLQDAARAIALNLVRRSQPDKSASVEVFLRASTRAMSGAGEAILARKPLWCEPSLRVRFLAACSSHGLHPSAAAAMALSLAAAFPAAHAANGAPDALAEFAALDSPVCGRKASAAHIGASLRNGMPSVLADAVSRAGSGNTCWTFSATRRAFDDAQKHAAAHGLNRSQWLRALVLLWTERNEAKQVEAETKRCAVDAMRIAAEAEAKANLDAAKAQTTDATPVANDPEAKPLSEEEAMRQAANQLLRRVGSFDGPRAASIEQARWGARDAKQTTNDRETARVGRAGRDAGKDSSGDSPNGRVSAAPVDAVLGLSGTPLPTRSGRGGGRFLEEVSKGPGWGLGRGPAGVASWR